MRDHGTFVRTVAILIFLLAAIRHGYAENHGRPGGMVRVLDAVTGEPVSNCALRFEDWRPMVTDVDGVCRCIGGGFDTRLRACTPLLLWHPDYESTRTENYEIDSDDAVTVLLEKGGTASLTIETADMASKPHGASQYRVWIRRKRTPVRESPNLSPATVYRFSGLAAGPYYIRVDRWDGRLYYKTHCRNVVLNEGEHLHLTADSLGSYSRGRKITPIPCAGLVLDKRTGKPLGGVRVCLRRHPRPDPVTGPDGRFWTMIDREDIYLARGRLPGPEIRNWPYEIDDEAARNLVFHLPLQDGGSLDSTGDYPLYPFDPNTGVCCNGLDCTICGPTAKVRRISRYRQPQGRESQASNEMRAAAQRVEVAGIVRDKRDGAGLAGVTVHFVGAPRDNAITAADGRFVTTTHRARLGQCGLIYNIERRSEQHCISFSVPMDVDAELVKQLEIHTLPDNLLKPVKVQGPRRTYRRLEWNDERPGVLCDGVDCALCGTHTAEQQTSQTTYESDLRAFFNEIDKTYPFFDLKGIRDIWAKEKPSLLERVRQCESDEDFLLIVIDAIRVLRDAHIGIVKTQVSIPRPAPQYHPGVSFLPATDGRIVVMHAPKDMAGKLATGTIVTKIDGVDARRYLEKRGETAWKEGGIYSVSSPQRARLFEFRLALCGEKGAEHKLTYLQGHQKQSLTVECRFPARGWPHIYNLPAHLNRVGRSFFYTQLADKTGYMYLRRVDSSIPEGIDEALRTHPNAKGWIVDMRGNGGGGYDRKLIEKIKRIPQPVAVLIDAGCTSAGETLARDFRALANARLFGSQSAGSSSSKRVWSFPSGVASIRIPVRSRWRGDGKPIEFNGIEPDVQVRAVPEELKAGRNSAILRAQEYIAQETREQAPAEQDAPPGAAAIPPGR